MSDDMAQVDQHVIERAGPTDRFGAVLMLLVASFLLSSVDDRGDVNTFVSVINAATLLLVFRNAGLVRSRSRLAALIAVGLATVAVAVVVDITSDMLIGPWIVQALVLAAVITTIARRVITHEQVGIQTLLGAVCIYMLIGLIFGTVYGAFDAVLDEPVLLSHSGGSADPMYYSFITLTTVGFGDITSTVDLVRHVTVVEAMFGQVFLATMVARLVSLYGNNRTPR